MKKKFFLLVILLISLFSCENKEKSTRNLARKVKIISPKQMAVKYNENIPIKIKVLDGVNKITFISNKKNIFKINNPLSGETTQIFKASDLGLGRQTIVVESYLTSGKKLKESSSIMVYSDTIPKEKIFKIIKQYPHNKSHFTQGLEFYNNNLIESTGLKGKSSLYKLDLNTGKVKKQVNLNDKYFGEGVTVFNDKIYQITWQSGKCFVYDVESLKLINELGYNGEGWGLTHNDTCLIMSNGTNVITFREPKNFNIIKQINVVDDSQEVYFLNELEYFEDAIYANVYQTNDIIKIDPNTGKVLERINGSIMNIEKNPEGLEFNGIAYNSNTNKLYVTGKQWDKVYQVTIE